ncbi:putative integral membrane protein [Aspergillus niger]|uniref:Putative integral membrane protein n=1 Tax=Aspergillus niger TaxID=5061 RepID=A0A505I7G7_ASPNG|nr:putative integral membrane protein [Aspergillus niger]
MEQSPPQNIMPGLHRAPVDPGSLPPEYWNSFEPLYTNPDPPHQHSHPSQPPQLQQIQPAPPQQQHATPMGISWDHPMFSQTPQSRSPLPTPQEQNHGIYTSATPQSWRTNPLQSQQIIHPAPQTYSMNQQYRQAQFPHAQPAFDSQPLPSSDNSHFQSYTFPRGYYPPQNLSVPDVFPQSHSPRPTQAQAQPTQYRSDSHQHQVPQYTLPAGYPEGTTHIPINFAAGYGQSTPTVSEQTINPQFLNSPQQAASQQASLHNNLMYMNPADFERPEDPKLYTFFRDDLQVPPILGQGQGQDTVTPVAPVKAAKPKKQPSVKKQSQPKKPTMKGGSKKLDGQSASSSSESDSSDESDLEIQEPEEVSPLPPTRPSEPEAAARYDALKAVWSPRNRHPNVDKVKSALVAFKDVVKAVRDAWKESSQAMKVAENKGDNDKAAQLKKNVVLQRRLMDVVISTTQEQGHPVIVEKLGEHPMAVAALYSFLLDRHQASDIDGALTVNILKLLSRFVTMDEDVLQKTNVAKLLPRFVKKGGPTVKELAQKIMDNAAASTKRKLEAGKSASKDGSPKTSVPDGSVPDGRGGEATGSKRPREGEGNGQPATKRMVVTANPKPAAKPNSTAVSGVSKRPQEVGQDNKPAAANAARPKANIIAPKPTSLFGSLSSASKRPGTSNAERAAAAAAAAKASNPAEKKESQPPPPRPTFSFGDLMADLNKQKDPAPAQPAEDRPPESEEERKKRLRKEARRKLRVTWKPDASLTEVRLFTHDPEEELGPGDHLGDVKGEGSVLKLHRDLDELEEEDDGGIREEQLSDYYEPSEIDNGDIAPDDRSRNYIKRGGTAEPTSPEKNAQEHREATTLMVFYTSPADVPSTPKEPPPADAEDTAPEVVSFGELPDHVKARQDRYFAMVNPQPAPAPQSAPNAPFDISNLLKIIQSAPQQQSTPPLPQPQVAQAPMSDLERTFSISHRLLSLQMQPAPIVPQAQPSQPSIAPNLAAIISQLTSQNQSAAANGHPPPGHYEDPERKRIRETGGYDGNDDERFNSKRSRSNEPNKKHPKAGLVPCRYWREGKCRKGDECTFRHDPLD